MFALVVGSVLQSHYAASTLALSKPHPGAFRRHPSPQGGGEASPGSQRFRQLFREILKHA
jgi:hypothetical protein